MATLQATTRACASNADLPRPFAVIAATAITFCGFLARLWAAHGTFLNPDEALHFRLANQPTLALAYRESLTASHPPLLTVVLYFWRALGTSELWLRMPLVLAGTIFCWLFYKWLAKAAGEIAGLAGLLFVAFLPPIVALGAEIRQYALLLVFLAGALYFLDEAFARNSTGRMAAFAGFLYLAMLSHYSAFLLAAALGIYALAKVFQERPGKKLISAWVLSQTAAIALGIFLYKTHLAKLGAGDSRTVLQGWMSDFYLQHSYFNAARDNPFSFVLWHSFGVFQYFFGQNAVGDAMGVAFIGGVGLLLRGLAPGARGRRLQLSMLLLITFAIAAAASLADLYPYGGTRHVAFLIIPAIAGVSIAIAGWAAPRSGVAIGIAILILVVCVATGKTRRPYMTRADQGTAEMAAAMEFIKKNVGPESVIFTDYESDLVLGHYLCGQKPISFEISNSEFEAFSCGRKVISGGFRAGTNFTPENFGALWKGMIDTFGLPPGETVWVFQAGWDADLPDQLKSKFGAFGDLKVNSFGKNIKIFPMTVGQRMPSS